MKVLDEIDDTITMRLDLVVKQKNHKPSLRRRIRDLAVATIESRKVAGNAFKAQIRLETVTPLEVVTIVAELASHEPASILEIVIHYMNFQIDRYCYDLHRESVAINMECVNLHVQTLSYQECIFLQLDLVRMRHSNNRARMSLEVLIA